MKKRILAIIILPFFFSCKKENIKSDFIGNWSSTSDMNIEIDIKFFKDSMVVDNSIMYDTYSDNWKIRDSKIELTLLRGDTSIFNNKHIIDYEFNLTKDTLLIKSENDSIFRLKLKKIKNNFEYIENKVGLDLKLPETSEKLTEFRNKEFAFNIYIGKKNDSLIARTDNSHNLNRLKYEVFPFYYSKKEKNIDSLNFILFTDNSVHQNELDSIKTILKKLPIKSFFRIYNSEKYVKNDWKAEIKLLGKYEN
ncbi:hypothetical protein CXF68_17865 [Tenacibaculum sp. Bg11-29]|uniref:hypothetical protein n=1 Tax=Tenacibaculum sp. Bg11-29 TaxID=2058306 RepID=UPI000C33F128|nr:hypothetical protein [Tenacibaculum sp. Bg11-29]PKH52444.1 hypothetical protein CXF68_17865 [Tenacibaculum sp. Bg11-29]